MSHQRPQGGAGSAPPPPPFGYAPATAPPPPYGYAPPPGSAPSTTGNAFAPPPSHVVPYAALQGAGRPRTRPWALWTLGVLAVAGVVVLAMVVVPRVVPVVKQQATKQSVLASGYETFTGPRGLTPPGGAPWGTQCAAVVLYLPATAPRGLQTALKAVVAEAHRGGVNVAVEDPARGWDPRTLVHPPADGVPAKVVSLIVDDRTPGLANDGTPETLRMGWNMDLSPDGLTEYLTMLRSRLFTVSLADDPLTERQALRSVIAWSQGISGSTLPGSGIAYRLRDSGDAFTVADLAAMRAMSGCG